MGEITEGKELVLLSYVIGLYCSNTLLFQLLVYFSLQVWCIHPIQVKNLCDSQWYLGRLVANCFLSQ
jgi:hypothetical protein